MQVSSPALFITITLNPNMYVYKSKIQLDRTKDLVKKILGNNMYYGAFELTKQHNIHYHILILQYIPRKSPTFYWKNKFRRGSNGKIDELGFNKVSITNSYKEINRAICYINKDIDNTYNLLEENPIMKSLSDELSQTWNFSQRSENNNDGST